MVAVATDDLWLNPLSDVTKAMQFGLNDITYAPVIDLDTTQRAAGNYTADGIPGAQMVANVSLTSMTDVQAAQLLAWFMAGETLCLRARNQKFWGVITPGATFQPRPVGDSWVIPFTVAQVTVSELG